MKAIQFGAGNIGRGFIGYLLNKSDYEVVFSDIFENVIEEINNKKEYTVFLKDLDSKKELVKGIRAVNSLDDKLIKEIEDADIITTAVGVLNLSKISDSLAKGIKLRYENKSTRYLNIIACENAVKATSQLKKHIYENLNEEIKKYTEKYVGFPNSSVDRIVPPSNHENILDVSVEKYYEWNVEKQETKGDLSKIKGMNLVENLESYVERKLFTLNTGHATTAYLGCIHNYINIEESINDKKIEDIVSKAMKESGDGLIKKYHFDKEDHYEYIEKIIKRFKNPYLKDDVKRVGREPIRKLSKNERLIRPLNTALQYKLPVDNLVIAIAAALHFNDYSDKQAEELQRLINDKGLREAIKEITELKDDIILEKILKAYNDLSKIKK